LCFALFSEVRTFFICEMILVALRAFFICEMILVALRAFFICVYLFLTYCFKYAFINISISPSITAVTLDVSTLLLWSLTMLYGWNTYDLI
jgi:hypothetical protein